MSRTRKGSKGCGYEYWGRRPLSMYDPSAENKRLTHRLERTYAKREIRELVETGDPPKDRR